jgi:hypothetical protein
MRVKLIPAITISTDSEGESKLFAPDHKQVGQVIDGQARMADGTAHVDANATKALSFGDVASVKGLWLQASADCQLAVNGSEDLLQLRSPAGCAGASGPTIVLEADIASISITAGSAGVDVIYAVWGDVPSST